MLWGPYCNLDRQLDTQYQKERENFVVEIFLLVPQVTTVDCVQMIKNYNFLQAIFRKLFIIAVSSNITF